MIKITLVQFYCSKLGNFYLGFLSVHQYTVYAKSISADLFEFYFNHFIEVNGDNFDRKLCDGRDFKLLLSS